MSKSDRMKQLGVYVIYFYWLPWHNTILTSTVLNFQLAYFTCRLPTYNNISYVSSVTIHTVRQYAHILQSLYLFKLSHLSLVVYHFVIIFHASSPSLSAVDNLSSSSASYCTPHASTPSPLQFLHNIYRSTCRCRFKPSPGPLTHVRRPIAPPATGTIECDHTPHTRNEYNTWHQRFSKTTV